MIKNPPANAEHQGLIPGLGRFPLEKGMATHSSILDWSIPTDRGAWRVQSVHREGRHGRGGLRVSP